MKFDADKMTGYFGEYGGQYIPEILRPAIKELEAEFKKAINDKSFIEEFNYVLKNFVGRPTP